MLAAALRLLGTRGGDDLHAPVQRGRLAVVHEHDAIVGAGAEEVGWAEGDGEDVVRVPGQPPRLVHALRLVPVGPHPDVGGAVRLPADRHEVRQLGELDVRQPAHLELWVLRLVGGDNLEPLAARKVPQRDGAVDAAGDELAAGHVERHRREAAAKLEAEDLHARAHVPHADGARLVAGDDEEEGSRVQHRDERMLVALRCEQRRGEHLVGRRLARMLPQPEAARGRDERRVMRVEADRGDLVQRVGRLDDLKLRVGAHVPEAHLAVGAERDQNLRVRVVRELPQQPAVAFQGLQQVARLNVPDAHVPLVRGRRAELSRGDVHELHARDALGVRLDRAHVAAMRRVGDREAATLAAVEARRRRGHRVRGPVELGDVEVRVERGAHEGAKAVLVHDVRHPVLVQRQRQDERARHHDGGDEAAHLGEVGGDRDEIVVRSW